MHTEERIVPVPGGNVWLVMAGGGDGVPLLTLHGGPGFCHNYIRSLEGLGDERTVIFFDQLGCGKSERPGDPSLWTVDRFVEEVVAVTRALALERFHLLGQSWGCMLGVDYALAHPEGIVSLILASPPLSIPRWVEDATRLVGELPEETREVLRRHEHNGFMGCPEYQAASLQYYKRHVCTLEPWPDDVERSFVGAGMDVYETMWGPNEYTVTGSLADYDRTARLHEITLPTLYTCGRYDEATSEATRWYQELTPNSEMVVFENSSHMGHIEEKDRYLEVVRDFLRSVEVLP